MTEILQPSPRQGVSDQSKLLPPAKGRPPWGGTWAVLTILLVGGLIFASGVGGYIVGIQKAATPKHPVLTPASTPSQAGSNTRALRQTPTLDISANWQEYKSPQFGFSIKYPSGWYAGLSPNDPNNFYISDQPIPTTPLENGIPSGFQLNITELPAPSFIPPFSYDPLQVNGIPATRTIPHQPDRVLNMFLSTVLFDYGRYTYTVTYPNFDKTGNHDPLFGQILSTLTIHR